MLMAFQLLRINHVLFVPVWKRFVNKGYKYLLF